MKKLALCLWIGSAVPAFAHVGSHGGLDVAALMAHLFEPDHLFFAAVTIVASVLAYRAGRRAEARAVKNPVSRREDRR